MALIVKHGTIAPIVQQNQLRNCEYCRRERIAKWTIKLSERPEFWCSKCFLYETAWGKDNAESRESIIALVETEMKQSLRGDDGKLTDDGADRILVSAVMVGAAKAGRDRAKNTGS